MSRINNKNIYRILVITSFILLNVAVLFGISQVLGYLNSGADRSSMLHVELETTDAYLPKVSWQSLENPGRIMETQTLKEIEKDYLFSWHVRNRALQTNDSTGIEDFYTDSARVNLFRLINHNKKQKVTVETTTLEHHPYLEFYSADGQLVVFTDKNIVEYRQVFKDKKPVSTVKDTATYKVMMLLEDGFWRIRHMRRQEKETLPADSLKPSPIYTVKAKKILKEGKEFTIKGINYYPKNSAWDMFGSKFNKDTIAADLDIIKNAGLNTIRIFIQYEDFGKAEVDTLKMHRMKETLDLAQQKKLAVIVTLFDFYGDYSVDTWTLTHRHAETIISAFKDHPAILAWDIKNEPDLDFTSRKKENVLAWLENLLPYIKQWDPNHLVTVGWSNPDDATLLDTYVDYVSYHYYQNIDHFEAKHQILEKAVNKPVVVEEFGTTSYNGFWALFGDNEDDQAEYHKKMQAVFKKHKLAFVSWTLYDFPSVPSAVVGKKPWVRNKQKEFGFITVDGKKKPSFLYITY